MNSQTLDGLLCHGIELEGARIPPFHVRPRQMVKICLSDSLSRRWKDVIAVFCDEKDPRVGSNGAVVTFDLPMPRSRFLEMFHRQTAAEWLMARAGMGRETAMNQLNSVDVKPDAPLTILAGNPRWMIGFLAAMHQRPSALVFTTIGCDTTGMERGLAAVRDRIGNTAAVYLSCFNDLNIVEPDYAAVLKVKPVTQAAVA